MVWRNKKPAILYPGPSQVGWPAGIGDGAIRDRQREPQAVEGYVAILGEGSAFRCLGRHARRSVMQHDRRLDLVAVLPSRSTATGPFLVALPQQFVRIDRCWVA